MASLCLSPLYVTILDHSEDRPLRSDSLALCWYKALHFYMNSVNCSVSCLYQFAHLLLLGEPAFNSKLSWGVSLTPRLSLNGFSHREPDEKYSCKKGTQACPRSHSTFSCITSH